MDLLDEVRIWRAVRSAAQQIRENMHRRISGEQPGLLAYFQFTEGNGAVSVDSINGHSAAFVGTPAWQTSTVPFGAGSSASVTAVQSGVQSLAEVTMNLTEGFDNNSDVTATGIISEPNILPDGYLSAVGNRYFIVNTFGSTGSFTANISLNFGAGIIDPRADDLPGGVKLFRRSSNSDGVWTEIGGASSVSSATGVVTWNGITSAGQFAAVVEEAALPVELNSFTASSVRLNTELKWSTATEVNNHGFEVERKNVSSLKHQGSGVITSTWKPCTPGRETSNDQWTRRQDSSKGMEHSNVARTSIPLYRYRTLAAGKYSYRLKQIDRDGKFSYSPEVEVMVGSVPNVFALEQNYPNPFNPSTTIGFTIQVSGLTKLKIYDMIGKEVTTLVNEFLEAGVYHQRTFDASQLASGVYLARLSSGSQTQIKKLVLMK
jgi:hypothetical protein